MALPNLTREQAVERAALVTVDSYRIVIDLTDGEGKPGEGTFRSTTTVEFDALAGADTYIDIAADSIRSATLNGHDIDVSGYDESTGIPLEGLEGHNIVVNDKVLPEHRIDAIEYNPKAPLKIVSEPEAKPDDKYDVF